MQNNIFINDAIDSSFKLYVSSKDKKDSLNYNKFLCVIIRMLVLLFGEEEILECYEKKDEESFKNVITKYGTTEDEYKNFISTLEKFYNFNNRQEKKSIKKKNKYFNLVQKNLIDMLLKKNSTEKIDNTKIKDFYELLFTARSNNFYFKSTAVLLAYNPYEIDDYFKKQNILVGEVDEKNNN